MKEKSLKQIIEEFDGDELEDEDQKSLKEFNQFIENRLFPIIDQFKREILESKYSTQSALRSRKLSVKLRNLLKSYRSVSLKREPIILKIRKMARILADNPLPHAAESLWQLLNHNTGDQNNE